MFHIGGARHPGPGPLYFTPGQLSIEFVNVGGWLTSGDLALDYCAQFLAIVEHRLIPSGAQSVCHQLRRSGHQCVWAPACQDQVAGGHAGVGVVPHLVSPSFVTPQFQEFFQVGSGFENHSSCCSRRSGSSFCCLWLSGGGGGC